MRKEGLKKDGGAAANKNGNVDEIEVDSAAVAPQNDANVNNGGDDVDPLDGADVEDVEAPAKKKGKKAKDSVVEVAVPTSTDESITINDDDDDGKNGDQTKTTNGNAQADENGEEEDYEVEEIIAHKFVKKKQQFLVRWKNFPPENDTWEPVESLNCEELIEKYLEGNPEAAAEIAKKKKRAEKKEKKEKKPKKPVPKPTKKSSRVLNSPKKNYKEKDEFDVPTQKVEKDYEVRDIVDHKYERGRSMFLIRWKGYSANSDTWEPESTLSCPDIVKRYKAEHMKKGKGKKGGRNDSDDDDADYEVEKIIGVKTERGKDFYLVHWKGWSSNDDTWEPESSLSCPDLIQKFNDQQRAKKRPAPASKKGGSSPSKKSKKSPGGKKGKKSKKYDSDDEDDDDNSSDDDEPAEDYEVEAIIDEKTERGKKIYLVKWKGWPNSSNTWEPESSLSCPDIVKKYRDSKAVKKSPISTKRGGRNATKNSSTPTSSSKKKKSAAGKTKSAPKSRAGKKKKKSETSDEENNDSQSDNDDIDGEPEWEVQEVIDVKYNSDGTREFKIRWKGCSSNEDTYEPESNLTCSDLIEKFMNKVDDDAPPRKKKTRKA